MYGGSVISCTTRERATCRLTFNAGQGITIENDGETSVLTSREQLEIRGDKLDIARAALIYLDVNPASHAFTLRLSTSIPMRAGLAGSTAMLATIVGALDRYLDLRQNPYALAETTRKVEARIMQV